MGQVLLFDFFSSVHHVFNSRFDTAVYEHETVVESWLKDGHKLVLENGKPLLQGEIMIRYYVKSSTNSRQEMQLTIDKMCTVREVRLVLDRKVLV